MFWHCCFFFSFVCNDLDSEFSLFTFFLVIYWNGIQILILNNFFGFVIDESLWSFLFFVFCWYHGIFSGVLIKIVLLLEMVLVHIIHDSFCIWKVLIVWPWIDWSSCFVGVDYIKSWIPMIQFGKQFGIIVPFG